MKQSRHTIVHTRATWPAWALVAALTVTLLGVGTRPAQASAEGRRNAILIGAAIAVGLLINAAEENHHRDRYDRDGFGHEGRYSAGKYKPRKSKAPIQQQYTSPWLQTPAQGWQQQQLTPNFWEPDGKYNQQQKYDW